jgi:hypothetical protein
MNTEDEFRQLQVRIETIAEDESIPGPTGVSLEDTLVGLTATGRRRVQKLLDREALSGNPERREAAERIRQMAERAWSASFPPQSVER